MKARAGSLFQEIRDHMSDTIGVFLGRDGLTPPVEILHDGTTSLDQFRAVGEQKVRAVIESGVKPNQRILDVGSGNGQLAIPLTRYLDADGRYEGFDIVPPAIVWCQENITTKYRNFRFQLADVYNKFYNPHGRFQASAYRFPYDDGFFDFVFVSSVFTHMLPEDVIHYVGEIARVLKGPGKCLASAYLLNARSKRAIEEGQSCFRFAFSHGSTGCRVENEDVPEAVVAHDEEFVKSLYERNRLEIGG